jgi:tripartite-type tricarboxylate transporter receptor subunit TctC
MNFASWGVGSTSEIAFEQMKQSTGTDMVHVSFKGAAPAITAVAAGDVQAFVVPLSVAAPQASAGRVKLAVTSAEREDSAPDVPTASEQGVPVVISGWHIIAVPKGTPRQIVARLNQALNAVTDRPDIRDKLAQRGVQPAGGTSGQAQEMVRSEWERWGQVVESAGISAD